MKSELIRLLKQFNYPVKLQGTMNKDENYPPSFFTFYNFQSPEDMHYSNSAARAVWGFWVYFYSEDTELVDTELLEAKKILKENGWICDGCGEDVASDVKSHTGRMITVYRIDYYKEENE